MQVKTYCYNTYLNERINHFVPTMKCCYEGRELREVLTFGKLLVHVNKHKKYYVYIKKRLFIILDESRPL